MKKFLFIGRHGNAPQKPTGGSYDRLSPLVVFDLFIKGKEIKDVLKEQGIDSSSRSSLAHTPKIRTKHTGQAFLIGALGIEPITGINLPINASGIEENYDWSNAYIYSDTRLSYGNVFFNEEVYNANGISSIENVNYWIKNPSATIHEGAEIEAYDSLRKRVNKAIRSNVHMLTGTNQSKESDIGVMVTHAGLVDTAIYELIRTSSGYESLDDISAIGGPIDQGEFAMLSIGLSKSQLPKATLELKGKTYKLNLGQVRFD